MDIKVESSYWSISDVAGRPAMGRFEFDELGRGKIVLNRFYPFKNDVPNVVQKILAEEVEHALTFRNAPEFMKQTGKDVKTLRGYIADPREVAAKANLEKRFTGVVSKELEPLAIEARKYKSAEEFVKAVKDKDIIVGEQKGILRTTIYSARNNLAPKESKASFNLEHNAKVASTELNKIKFDIKSLKQFGTKDSDPVIKNLQSKLKDKTKEWQDLSAEYWKTKKREVYNKKYGERDYEAQLTDFYNQAVRGRK